MGALWIRLGEQKCVCAQGQMHGEDKCKTPGVCSGHLGSAGGDDGGQGLGALARDRSWCELVSRGWIKKQNTSLPDIMHGRDVG